MSTIEERKLYTSQPGATMGEPIVDRKTFYIGETLIKSGITETGVMSNGDDVAAGRPEFVDAQDAMRSLNTTITARRNVNNPILDLYANEAPLHNNDKYLYALHCTENYTYDYGRGQLKFYLPTVAWHTANHQLAQFLTDRGFVDVTVTAGSGVNGGGVTGYLP